MTEFKCDTRSHGNFLYGKKQSVFTVLYRLYNHCYTILNAVEKDKLWINREIY